MKAHTHTLMAALLVCPALVAPINAEENQGGSVDPGQRLFALEKESWELVDVCFSHYVKMIENKINKTTAIDAISIAAGRLSRVREEIDDISQSSPRSVVARYEKTVSTKKYMERVKNRNHLANLIAADAKKKGYMQSSKLKKAMENLLSAIRTY